MDKAELHDRLRALPKNDAAAELPLQTRRLEGGPPGTLCWKRLPRPGAPRVVLVHGTPGTLYQWSRVVFGDGDAARGLAADFDVTLIELPGHGVHPDPGVPDGFQPLAAHLGRALDALALGPVVLVGHSYGGEVALRTALDRPELLSALVLVDAAGLPRADDEWLPEERALRGHPLARWGWLLNSADRVRRALAPHFQGRIPDGTLEEFVLCCANAADWRTMVALARDENGSRAHELPGLDVPTLLVWGAHDLAYPVDRFARRFLDGLPDAELVVVDGTGHYVIEERPEAFVELLRARFGGARAAGAARPGS